MKRLYGSAPNPQWLAKTAKAAVLHLEVSALPGRWDKCGVSKARPEVLGKLDTCRTPNGSSLIFGSTPRLEIRLPTDADLYRLNEVPDSESMSRPSCRLPFLGPTPRRLGATGSL